MRVLLIIIAILTIVVRSHVVPEFVCVTKIVEAVGPNSREAVAVLAKPVEPPRV